VIASGSGANGCVVGEGKSYLGNVLNVEPHKQGVRCASAVPTFHLPPAIRPLF
jgi:hypothetical protein